MKIIELAEKEKNKEIMPHHIRYMSEDLYYDGYTYTDVEGNNDILDILALYNSNLVYLFDEVEIIEEDKKIPEKIDMFDNFTGYSWSNKELWEQLERNTIELNSKINEIIDYLENKND